MPETQDTGSPQSRRLSGVQESRQYKYRRGNFGPLPVTLHHLTIYINFAGEAVEVTNCLAMTAKHDLDEIALDACSLEIIDIEFCGSPERQPRNFTCL